MESNKNTAAEVVPGSCADSMQKSYVVFYQSIQVFPHYPDHFILSPEAVLAAPADIRQACHNSELTLLKPGLHRQNPQIFFHGNGRIV